MRPFLTLHDPRRAAGWYEAGLWTTDTFYSLMADHARQRPDAAALRDGHETLTWAELKRRVDALAAEFEELGLVAGDRVSLWLSNRLHVHVVFLACSRIGIACNPSLHRTYTCGEIVELVTRLESAAFITEKGWGADRESHDLEAMLGRLPFMKKVYDLADLPQGGAVPARPPHDNPDTVGYLAFTSGTTGKPKCVMHSANTLLANGRDLVRDWAVGADTVLLSLSPMSHHIAWVGVGQWLATGCLFVTDDPLPGMSRLDWIVETGATYVLGVPTHAMDILEEQRRRGITRLGRVAMFYMAGAPIPSVVAEAFVRQGITPQNIYGMTENSSHQYTHPGDSQEIWVSTCGRGGPAYEVAIFDPENDERRLGPGETGQIGGRGAALMLGYFDNQSATEKSFNRQGWFLSGDLGSMDADGNLKIEGRLKDLIIRGGHNIYPSRIEALAVSHAGIAKAAAFAVPDERLGEKVCLAILGALEADAVLAHLAAAGLSKYDMPEWFLRMDAFPLTPSGKILKRELVAMVERGEVSPQAVRYVAGKENA
jgi:acyl-CoA synthetase